MLGRTLSVHLWASSDDAARRVEELVAAAG
jgi:hypothetical protein